MADDFPEENLNEDVALLRDAWANELNAPELLTFQTDLISDMVEQVQNQQSYVDEMSADVATLTEERSFTNKLYQMEIDRIKYMLASYLRLRLMKIERHTRHVLHASMDKLSPGEVDYAHSYKDLYESHCRDLLLSKLPPDHQQLDEPHMIDHPDLDTFVFCQSNQDIGNVQIDDRGSEHVNARKDDRHVLRYRVVSSLVEEGKVKLL
ncbi:hypothetical protein, variant 1 [Aphanomyces astaci]|uniref:DNA replication complex GINS protein SLD5 n=1 Tax=Aphanomyces astaci TaxID=112090 RepID=W4GLW1_APHAT|nr:hypothetical protein, variant 1 [Aphanomyces astaci]ETV80019.1 hypothetical protein, variant 1 [Aphanomyces astaci]|eukprot:XP_009830955.1 hypothetical protein, variant 1 [Aphanomyces astaci]